MSCGTAAELRFFFHPEGEGKGGELDRDPSQHLLLKIVGAEHRQDPAHLKPWVEHKVCAKTHCTLQDALDLLRLCYVMLNYLFSARTPKRFLGAEGPNITELAGAYNLLVGLSKEVSLK